MCVDRCPFCQTARASLVNIVSHCSIRTSPGLQVSVGLAVSIGGGPVAVELLELCQAADNAVKPHNGNHAT
ncbi:unnamed protein product [Urochloa humidicola]